MDSNLVVAFVRRSRRAAVEQALRTTGIDAWTESNVMGHGRSAGGHAVEHLRIEAVLQSGVAMEVLRAVSDAASRDATGNGLVLLLPVLAVHRLGECTPADGAEDSE